MQSNRDMKGKKIWTVAAGSACLLVGCAQQPQGYAEKILSNPLMNRVDSMERAVVATGFNEWYTPAGEPMGSGTFRGEAGVLYKANALLRACLLTTHKTATKRCLSGFCFTMKGRIRRLIHHSKFKILFTFVSR